MASEHRNVTRVHVREHRNVTRALRCHKRKWTGSSGISQESMDREHRNVTRAHSQGAQKCHTSTWTGLTGMSLGLSVTYGATPSSFLAAVPRPVG